MASRVVPGLGINGNEKDAKQPVRVAVACFNKKGLHRNYGKGFSAISWPGHLGLIHQSSCRASRGEAANMVGENVTVFLL